MDPEQRNAGRHRRVEGLADVSLAPSGNAERQYVRHLLEHPEFSKVIKAAVEAQRLVPGSVLVGGTAAALYAGHRLSLDSDHIVPGMASRFDEVVEQVEKSESWKEANRDPPKLLLGSLEGQMVGFRQLRRALPIETTTIETPYGSLTIPTLDEMLCIKAFLSYERNTVRDYVDFVALAQCTSREKVIESLSKLDVRYAGMKADSLVKLVAVRLASPEPKDLESVDLAHYKGLCPALRSWDAIASVCKSVALELGKDAFKLK
jgi:hypothetical protein